MRGGERQTDRHSRLSYDIVSVVIVSNTAAKPCQLLLFPVVPYILISVRKQWVQSTLTEPSTSFPVTEGAVLYKYVMLCHTLVFKPVLRNAA